jgi:hypothetical protein
MSWTDEYNVEMIRQALQRTTLEIDWGEDNINSNGIFGHIDSFVELCEGNDIVQEVELDQYRDNYSKRGLRRMEDWNKLGKGIGNLQALKELRIWGSVSGRTRDE